MHEGDGGRAQTGIHGAHLGREKALPTLAMGRRMQSRDGEAKEVVLRASGRCPYD